MRSNPSSRKRPAPRGSSSATSHDMTHQLKRLYSRLDPEDRRSWLISTPVSISRSFQTRSSRLLHGGSVSTSARTLPARSTRCCSSVALSLNRWYCTALLRGFQFAVLPTHRLRLHRIARDGSRQGVMAFGALKRAAVIALGAPADAGQRHAVRTFGAARPFDWDQRGFWSDMEFGHVMRPSIRRERNTPSHR
jgi:hypothetical protein